MKIVCPSCQAQYEVPELVLTSRRKMRCARCGGEWVPGDAGVEHVAPEPEPEREPDMVPEPPAAAAPAPEPATASEPPPPAAAPRQPERDEDLVTIAEPEPAWAEPAPAHHLEPEPEPRPVALRPETPVTLRPARPDPATIVVPPARRGPPVVEWIVSVALVLGLVAAAVVFRGPIMKAWPPSGRIYAVFGK